MLRMQQRLSLPFLMLLSLPSTAMGFALAVQISALSWLMSTKYGLKLDEIGIVWAAGPLAGILGQVIIGIISDGVWFWGGRRRPFILVGGVLTAAMLLALPSIGAIDKALGLDAILGVAVAVALALDLSINLGFNPTRSLITDVTPEGAKRTAGYTWMQTVSGTFGVLAYAIGAIYGNIALIYFGAGLALVFSIVPALLVEEPRVLAHTETGASAQKLGVGALLMLMRPLWAFAVYALIAMGLKMAGYHTHSLWLEVVFGALALVLIAHALTERQTLDGHEDLAGFRKVLAAHAISWFGMQTLFVFIIGFVQQRFPQLDDDATGQLMSFSFLSLNAVAAVLPGLVLNPLAQRFREVRVHAISLLLMAAGFGFVYLFVHSAPMLYLGMAIIGLGWGAIVSLPFAIFSQSVSPARIGLYMGVFNLSVVLPQLAVSLGVGYLLSQLENKALVFAIGGVCMALSAVAWLAVKQGPRRDVAEGAPAAH
ncbi:MAG: MFS transporter [Lysobacter sp.]|nr:MFS transporter [Lysobacter sp.]